MQQILIGTAGWSLPREEQPHFPATGSHLERYAAVFPVAEINSSFHRSHRASTWRRWHDSVPLGFRFSVKVPKSITHELRLRAAGAAVKGFLAEAGALGSKLGCLLVQLPPSLEFDGRSAESFFRLLAAETAVPMACEPRHASWFENAATELFARLKVARVGADPACVPAAAEPNDVPALAYYRLHGSPKMYYSAYSPEYLAALSERLRQIAQARPVWCIFDNTTLGAATRNARELLARVKAGV